MKTITKTKTINDNDDSKGNSSLKEKRGAMSGKSAKDLADWKISLPLWQIYEPKVD